MRQRLQRQSLAIFVYTALGVPIFFAHTALAATGSVGQVEGFLRSLIQIIAGLAGLVATGFFVIGGFSYITSAGNPERMSGAKRTITFSALGLIIVFAAFVLSNIVTDVATNAFGK
ncbi:TrbC/VirB2 family protein [Candidatus Saccharibacteria bacterium]|nr:TrbC/VirB2 family protein [Candidatus Saccharibacteria bacterium]